VSTVTVHPERARLSCAARLTVDTDGPVRVVFAGCGRAETFSGAGRFTRAGNACATNAGFRRARVRPRGRRVRVAFSRRARRPVTVDVIRHSSGRRAHGPRRVKRFRGRSRGVVWAARGARDGYYTVRLRLRLANGRVDTRRFVLERRNGRFARRPASVKRPDCRVLTAFSLSAPVFGGTTGRRLGVSYRLRSAARVRVDLLRGRKAVRRLAGTRRVAAGRTVRLRVRPRGLRAARHRVRLTIRRPGEAVRRVKLSAQRL
jgi:hypothetical protein